MWTTYSHHVLTLEDQTAKRERDGQQGKLTFITFLPSIIAFNQFLWVPNRPQALARALGMHQGTGDRQFLHLGAGLSSSGLQRATALQILWHDKRAARVRAPSLLLGTVTICDRLERRQEVGSVFLWGKLYKAATPRDGIEYQIPAVGCIAETWVRICKFQRGGEVLQCQNLRKSWVGTGSDTNSPEMTKLGIRTPGARDEQSETREGTQMATLNFFTRVKRVPWPLQTAERADREWGCWIIPLLEF